MPTISELMTWVQTYVRPMLLVDRRTAERQERGVGDELTITGTTGAVDTFRIDAISDDMTMLGAVWNLTTDDFVVLNPEALDAFIGVTIDDGADLEPVSGDHEELQDQYQTVSVEDSDAFIGTQAGQVTGLLQGVRQKGRQP